MFDKINLANERYTSHYCEENIWQLCRQYQHFSNTAYAVFISNPKRQVAIWQQRLQAAEGLPVVWDYHVIFVYKSVIWKVIDFDTRLPSPCPLKDYLDYSFAPLKNESQHFAPFFKCVENTMYLEHFSSDRRHMRNQDQWLAPPPKWPMIGQGWNLNQFFDMTDNRLGKVFSLLQLREQLQQHSTQLHNLD